MKDWLLVLAPPSKQEIEALKRVLKVFARCFLLGCSGQTLVNVLYLIIAQLTKKKPQQPGISSSSSRIELRSLLGLVAWRFGMFLGGFSAGYKLLILIFSRFSIFQKKNQTVGSSSESEVDNLDLQTYGDVERHSHRKMLTQSTTTALTYPQANNAACLLAGAISGTSLLFLNPSDRSTFALYGLTRAGEFFFRALAHTNKLPEFMTRFEHYDLLIMSLSASQILYCYVFNREALSPTYRHFLDKFGAKDVRVLNAIKAAYRSEPLKFDEIRSFCVSQVKLSFIVIHCYPLAFVHYSSSSSSSSIIHHPSSSGSTSID